MEKLSSNQLRRLYLDFFKERGHAVLESASLIPENDPTVLFTTAGMHPLVPYLMGAKHPQGTRLASVQKCVRTVDIEEVGDATHCTFFEMLGNWSLGDYFKRESIAFSYDFLINVLKIPRERIAVSVFKGDGDSPKDVESADYWLEQGLKPSQVYFLPKKNNWWGPAGLTGPCGPDTEIFIDTGKPKCSGDCSPACDCGKFIEIWNNVFMQYNKTPEGVFEPLAAKNVDTGMGLERTVGILNGLNSVYETDLFSGAISFIEAASEKKYGENPEIDRAMRIVADHIRTAAFILGDEKGVTPGNIDQGYVLRRLIRRAIRYARQLSVGTVALSELSGLYADLYADVYPELKKNRDRIVEEIEKEAEKFERTLSSGLKEFEKVAAASNGTIAGNMAFHLYDTFGFPIEITEELARDRGLLVDKAGFEAAFAAHQQLSQAGAEQKFKGGLHDHSEETTRLHTATHLLQAALRVVIGDEVKQKGSNITSERLRFDFSFHRPLTDEEIAETEDLVNQMIKSGIDVEIEEKTVEEAKSDGALGVFDSKYGEVVKVYSIGNFSKEICGGPHAKNTSELGVFKIEKEQSSSSGVRRIRATLK